MIIRGTTPAFVIRIENGSFSAYDEGYLTIRQDSKQLDIPFSEGTIVDNVLYLPRLKQEETLLFDATKQIKLQLKLRQLDNVTATNIVRLSAYPILSETVLETNGMTSGNTIEVTLHLLDAETIEVSAQIVEIAINSDIREHINATVSTEWQALYDSGALTGPAGPAGRDGNDYVITQADYNAIANITETLIQPTLDSRMAVNMSNIDEAGENKVKEIASEIIPTSTSELTNDSGFITDTNYATTTKGGAIKTSSTYGTSIASSGALYSVIRTIEQYDNVSVNAFISKGTLDNVLSQYLKAQALTQAEYDAIVEKDNGTLYVIVE